MSGERPKDEASIAGPAWAAEWAAHFLTVLLAFVVVGVITIICARTIRVDRDRLSALLPSLAVQPESITAEPAERAAFLSCLICVPVFMLLIHPIVRSHVARLPADVIWRHFRASCIVMLMLIGLGTLGDHGLYWSGSWVYTNPILFALATSAGAALTQFSLCDLLRAADRSRLLLVRDVGLALAVVALIGVTSVLRLLSGGEPYVTDGHFEAVFFASTQVALGATLLVDFPHQYGLYPEFLAPIFNLLGGITVTRFTVVMAMLQGIAYVLWLAALFRTIRTPWMAMLTFLGAFSLVSFLSPLAVLRHNIIPYYDPYFQYVPIRTLFPAIALYAIAWITEQERFERRVARCLPSAILGAGVLWNADAGVPALGAWIMCLCHHAIVRRHRAGPSIVAALQAAATIALEALLCAAATVALGIAALAWKAGMWPDLSLSLQHQKIFYEIGFFMLPMRITHSWVAWAAVIMAALSFGIWPLSTQVRDDRHLALRSTLFGWAVLACGLFSYYQGRSHDWVFPAVIPFALAIVGVAIARLSLPTSVDFHVPPKWRIANAFLTSAFVVAMASGAVGPWWNDATLRDLVKKHWHGLTTAATTNRVADAIRFVKQRLAPGEHALILSKHAGIYHAETKTKSMLPTSLVELMLRSDRDELLRTIADTKRIFVDLSVLSAQASPEDPSTDSLINAQLMRRFRPVAESPNGYLLELEPNPPASPDMSDAE